MPKKQTEPKPPILKDAEISYWLTGESVLKARALPFPPKSKAPTIVRFTHSNVYGPVDADIFVRIGNPKSPLGFTDFETVSDWAKATLVTDTVWDDKKDAWVPRPKKIVGETLWQATYEAELQFPPGKHLIDIKFVSPIKYVCSVVFSNWQVNVK